MTNSTRVLLLASALASLALAAGTATAGESFDKNKLRLSGSLSQTYDALGGGGGLSSGGVSGSPYTGQPAAEASRMRSDVNNPLTPGSNPRAVSIGGSNTTWYEQ